LSWLIPANSAKTLSPEGDMSLHNCRGVRRLNSLLKSRSFDAARGLAQDSVLSLSKDRNKIPSRGRFPIKKTSKRCLSHPPKNLFPKLSRRSDQLLLLCANLATIE
jgi:hypothetical protein